MVSITENVAAGADDGYSSYGNYQYLTFTKINMRGGANTHVGGVRFQSLAIPAGATIDSATLTTVVTNTQSPIFNIYGHDVDDAPAWGTANKMATMTKTTANATLSVASGTNTDSITGIVAEIVGRTGWASGNDMAFGFFPTDTTGVGSSVRLAAYEHATENAAILKVTYTEAVGGSVPANSLQMMGLGI